MRAETENAQHLSELVRTIWPDHTIEELTRIINGYIASEESAVFMETVNGQYAGDALCGLRHDYVEGCETSPVGYLEGVSIHEAFRYQGIARKLVSECEQWAKEKGCREFASDCELTNTASLNFHLSVSFQEEIGSSVSRRCFDHNCLRGETPMDIIIKRMETPEEIRGKAFVHWRCWHEVYAGIVNQDYLDKMTLDKFEEKAFLWLDNIFVAKEDDRVIGFIGYGDHAMESPAAGEIFALYLLPEYCGKGIGLSLMEAALEHLKEYTEICLWVFKENRRAIRFYHKCGFHEDGMEKFVQGIEAAGIRMILRQGR